MSIWADRLVEVTPASEDPLIFTSTRRRYVAHHIEHLHVSTRPYDDEDADDSRLSRAQTFFNGQQLARAFFRSAARCASRAAARCRCQPSSSPTVVVANRRRRLANAIDRCSRAVDIPAATIEHCNGGGMSNRQFWARFLMSVSLHFLRVSVLIDHFEHRPIFSVMIVMLVVSCCAS